MSNVKRNKWLRVLAIVLVAVAVLSLNAFVASAEEIDVTNPELTLTNINSDVESDLSGLALYKCEGTIKQGSGKYTINSNAYVPWLVNDDVSFAYNTFNVSDEKSDTITYEVTLESFSSASGTLPNNAHAGIMFRSGLNNDAAEVFLHYRPGEGIVAVYRSLEGGRTLVRYSGLETPQFPIQLKMVKIGTTITMYFKDTGMDSYRTFQIASFAFSAPGPLYAGLGVCSQNPDVVATAEFSNIRITGKGSYVPSNDDSGSGSGTTEEPELPEADEDIIPTNQNIVLYETFTDADLTDGKMAIGEYDWNGGDKATILTEHANRFLYRSFIDASPLYVGDEAWTDYKTSVDISFTKDNEMDYTASDLAFRMLARCTRNVFYGVSGYAAVLKNTSTGPVLSLYKQTNTTETVSTDGKLIQTVAMDNFYGDGLWHNLSIYVLDNNVKVYWDGVCKIDFYDDGNTYGTATGYDVCSQGAIGFSTNGCDVQIDNLTVTLIEDTLNGSFDNYIGGMWNEEIPEYILEAIEDGVSYDY